MPQSHVLGGGGHRVVYLRSQVLLYPIADNRESSSSVFIHWSLFSKTVPVNTVFENSMSSSLNNVFPPLLKTLQPSTYTSLGRHRMAQ